MQSKWNLHVSNGKEKAVPITASDGLTSPCSPHTVSSRPWLPSGTRSTSSSRAAVWTSLFRHPQPRASHPALRPFVHLQLDFVVLPRFVVVLSQQLRPSSAWPSQPQADFQSLRPPQPSRTVSEHECWPVWPWLRMDELDGGGKVVRWAGGWPKLMSEGDESQPRFCFRHFVMGVALSVS